MTPGLDEQGECDRLEVVELQSKLLASPQLVEEALVAFLSFLSLKSVCR
jgi:hypothetical protein